MDTTVTNTSPIKRDGIWTWGSHAQRELWSWWPLADQLAADYVTFRQIRYQSNCQVPLSLSVTGYNCLGICTKVKLQIRAVWLLGRDKNKSTDVFRCSTEREKGGGGVRGGVCVRKRERERETERETETETEVSSTNTRTGWTLWTIGNWSRNSTTGATTKGSE